MKPAALTLLPTAALLILLTSPALAVNKCVDETGKVVYQSAPCPTTSKGSELTLQKAASVPAPSPADAAELQRIRQTASAMERELKLKDIDREIKRLEGRIVDHRSAMDSEMASLRQKKQFALNNLAGATWEQSISDEMNAVTQKYDALIRSDRSQLDQLRNDADRLRKTE